MSETRDAVVADLQQRLASMAMRIGVQHPCVICEWPRPPNNEHAICACCGFQEGYDDPAIYQWDGTWWAVGIVPMPKILRCALGISELKAEDRV